MLPIKENQACLGLWKTGLWPVSGEGCRLWTQMERNISLKFRAKYLGLERHEAVNTSLSLAFLTSSLQAAAADLPRSSPHKAHTRDTVVVYVQKSAISTSASSVFRSSLLKLFKDWYEKPHEAVCERRWRSICLAHAEETGRAGLSPV